MDLEGTRQCIDALRRAQERHGRPSHLGDLQIIVTPTDGQDPDNIRRYAELGVDCIVALPRPAERGTRHEPVPRDAILRTIDLLSAAVL